jgi:type II secretory pathway component PulL
MGGPFYSLRSAKTRTFYFRIRVKYLVARNVEELRWVTRQNLEEMFRMFQARMEVQLVATISGIRTAIRTALDRQAQREASSIPQLEKLEGFRQQLEHLLAELAPQAGPASYGSPV